MTKEERTKKLCKIVSIINQFNPDPKPADPEYIFVDAILPDDLLDPVLALKKARSAPIYIDEFAARLETTVEEAAAFAARMTKIGIAEYRTDENGVDMLYLPVFGPGSMENFCMEREKLHQTPQAAYGFNKFFQSLTESLSPYIRLGHSFGVGLPVESSIKNEPKTVDLERTTHWLEKYDPSIGVAQCQCRATRNMLGELGHDLEGEWCIVLGQYAESCIRTGKARRITKAEAYEIIQRAEDRGYCHEVTNVDGAEESLFICNCHYATCAGLRTAWYCNTPELFASNFRATVEKDKCVACGQCVEVCPINAVKLGTRLCEKEPAKIKTAVIPGMEGYGREAWKPHLLTEREYVWPETGTAPCKTACPAHIAIQGYIRLASEGKYREAIELIKKENPLPAICGSICNKRCEDACTRGKIDEPVSIDEIKRFIAMQEIHEEDRVLPKIENEEGYKVAVIGSGPAGLACAYYLTVYGHKVTVYEKENRLGGMLTLGIPSFRLEKEIVEAEIDVLRQMGVKFVTNAEVGKFVTLADLRLMGFKAFYIAIGAQGGRRLRVEGEEAKGVVSGVDFLRRVNQNEADRLEGRTVVIGGGNVAVDVARTAVRMGTGAVSMYCLEAADEMPASGEEVEDTKGEGVAINNGWGPKRILTADGRVTGVEFKRCTSVFDENGRFAPVYDENETMTVECENVLTAIGQSIQWGSLLEGTKVQLNKNGTAKTNPVTEFTRYNCEDFPGLQKEKYELPTPFEVYQTDEPDVFVGGDVYSGPKFAIDAIAAGKEGAESIHRFVWNHNMVVDRDRKKLAELNKENMDLSTYDQTPRQRPVITQSRKNSFQDPRKLFTKEQIQKETSRCLGCGAAWVDETLCLGCGVCTTRCKFDAIHLHKKFNTVGLNWEDMCAEALDNMAKAGK